MILKISGKIKIPKINLTNLFLLIWSLYLTGYVFFSASEATQMYNVSPLWSIILILVCGMLCVFFLFTKKITPKRAVITIAFAMLIMLIILKIKSRQFLAQSIFMVMAYYIDFNTFVKFDLKLRSILFCSVVGLCLLGVLDNYSSTFYDDTIKMALGFSHPNIFVGFAFSILIEWLYIRYDVIKIWEYIAILVVYSIVLHFAAARTTAYTFMLIFLLIILSKIKPEWFYSRIAHIAFVIVTPVMLFFSYYSAYLYGTGSAIGQKLNELLSMRLEYGWYFISEYGFNLFGQQVELVSSRSSHENNVKAAILDNSYIRCGIIYGILFLLLFCICYMVIMHILLKKKYIQLALFILYYLLIGFGEAYTINLCYNVSMLCLLSLVNIKELKFPWNITKLKLQFKKLQI